MARIGHLIASQTEEVDTRVLFLFAAVHDSQRENDGRDPEHGPRAAGILSEIDHGLEASRLDELAYALRHHTEPLRHKNPTVGACWDADRLTLDRVRIEPEPRYLSSAPVREDFDHFHELAREVVFGPDRGWDQIADDYVG